MPNFEVHEAATLRNQKVLDCLLENDDHSPDDFAHWEITNAFYKALHLVEALFSQAKRPFHSKDHQERNRRLRDIKKYEHIWKHYRPLFETSMAARYSVDPSTGKDLLDLNAYLSGRSTRAKFIDHHLRQIENSYAAMKADEEKRG